MMPDSGSSNFRSTRITVAAVAVVCLIALIVSLFIEPREFFISYLMAFTFWISIPLGCIAILMMQHVTGGDWGKILKPALIATTPTVPLMALLFTPLLFGMGFLYPWTNDRLVAATPELQEKHGYLNTAFFIVRAAVYFTIWSVYAFLLAKWNSKMETDSLEPFKTRLARLSGPGMFVLGVTLTLAMVDWVMSLEPLWYSTIYGLIWITGSMLAGFSLAIPLMLMVYYPGHPLTGKQMRDLGNLLLAFVMLWTYCSFAQFMLIWVGNLPLEVRWYVPRVEGVWGGVAIVLVVLHFALPFVLLLFRGIKKEAKYLGTVGLFIFLMRFVNSLWMVEPAFPPRPAWTALLDAVATLGLGAIWFLVFFQRFGERPPELYYAE